MTTTGSPEAQSLIAGACYTAEESVQPSITPGSGQRNLVPCQAFPNKECYPVGLGHSQSWNVAIGEQVAAAAAADEEVAALGPCTPSSRAAAFAV